MEWDVCMKERVGIKKELESHPYHDSLAISQSVILVAQLCLTLWPHELQHTRLPCPSTTPGACSNSCPLKWWCHPTFSSSVMPLSSFLQSFSASGYFPMSQFFASGGQSIRHLPHHNYWVGALEPGNCNYWDHMQQLLKVERPRAHAPQLEKAPYCKEDPSQP